MSGSPKVIAQLCGDKESTTVDKKEQTMTRINQEVARPLFDIMKAAPDAARAPVIKSGTGKVRHRSWSDNLRMADPEKVKRGHGCLPPGDRE